MGKELSTDTEIKQALEILEEATSKFGSAFVLVQQQIEKELRSNSKVFLETIKKGRTVQLYVYSMITNEVGDMLESGEFHMYRGVLNPMKGGNTLLKIYDYYIDELITLNDITQEYADDQKKILRNNINDVG